MKITSIDQRDPSKVTKTEHDVDVTADSQRGFQFKSHDFPPPALGRKFFRDGREVQVTELKMEQEEGKAVFYFSATFASQP